ncbi:MAG: hypothetical protein VXV85_07780, partial [Candidatus Thermoplasmatota archaeon]|nr:hypothetical protein [Candidatus Thermoplasmatota archaeon]
MIIGNYHNLLIRNREIIDNKKIENDGKDGNDGVIEREMSRRERDKKEDEGGVENLKKIKAFLRSEYEKKCPYD